MAISDKFLLDLYLSAVSLLYLAATHLKLIFGTLSFLAFVRTFAPLRRIIGRDLEVYAFHRASGHPLRFVVHDVMECGHVHTDCSISFSDLIDAYSECAVMRARRHRCHDCATLALAKKPVRSVGLADVAVSA